MKLQNVRKSIGFLVIVILSGRTHAFHSNTQTTTFRFLQSSSSPSCLKSFINDNEKPFSKKKSRRGLENLSAISITGNEIDKGYFLADNSDTALRLGEFMNGITPVITASLMITGNSIGATCLVIPEICAGPGLAMSLIAMVACFVTNLISGLIIAEVTIKQHEVSRHQSPSSFKELAEMSFNSKIISNIVAAVALFSNMCVTSFDLGRMGEVLATSFTGLNMNNGLPVSFVEDPSIMFCMAYAAMLAFAASTLSLKQLGSLAGYACTGLFVTLAAILLPGIFAVQDPAHLFLSPGTASNPIDALSIAVPIILSAMVYQNIVPSVTKRLKYDRQQTAVALTIGSFIPLMIYFLYSYVVIGGGGGDVSGGLLMTAFSVTTILGSSIACVISMSEELENYIKSCNNDGTQPGKIYGKTQIKSLSSKRTASISNTKLESHQERFSSVSVLIAVSIPLSVAITFSGGDDMTIPLRIAGSYGTPLLYGALPVAMAWNQRRKLDNLRDMVPGGQLSLGGVATLTTIYFSQALFHDVSWLTMRTTF